jgi:SAM-dependent methyltransferase
MITSWTEVTDRNPDHSRNYIARWESFEAQGRDINGEARLIDALASDGDRILDAGAGTGRLAGYLAARNAATGNTGRNLQLTGVDIDPALVDYARGRYPGVDWHTGDLSVDAEVPAGPFDLIVSAGNVLAFIPDPAHRAALGVLKKRLAPGGRLVVGFGLDRGRDHTAFSEDAAAVGLRISQEYSSWDLRPRAGGAGGADAAPDAGFLVAILEPEVPHE